MESSLLFSVYTVARAVKWGVVGCLGGREVVVWVYMGVVSLWRVYSGGREVGFRVCMVVVYSIKYTYLRNGETMQCSTKP